MSSTRTDRPPDVPTAPPPAGSPGDFEELVAATGRRMYAAALLLCGGDHHLAEDLTQATYTKVFVSWRRVSRADDPVAYTRTMLTRTFLSHRRLRRSSERPTDDLPDTPAPAGRDLDVGLDLLAALRELSPQDRAVVVLRYHHDLTAAETAAALGISEAACRQRARRALARLRTHLPDLDPEDPA